jgi:hypothetical protein
MSNIIISPLRSHMSPAFEAVNLNIVTKDSDFEGLFNLLEVWRSRSTASGPYEELTSDFWRPARLPKNGGDIPESPVSGPSVQIVGKTLELVLKERDTIAVVFSGTDPLTLAQVASQIAAQSAGRLRSYVDGLSHLVIETLEPGTGACLRVIPSDAASILALPLQSPDYLAFGKDARIQVIAGVHSYLFTDLSGSTEFFYKTRFRNSSTIAFSEFSLPFGSGQEVGLNLSQLVCGYVDLVDLQGKPLVGREVSLSSQFNGTVVDGKSVAGNPLMKRTDLAGHVEFTLVRGMQYDLAIAGMNLVKTIVVPTDLTVSSFRLLDPDISEQQDYFRVRVPQIPTLLRNV